MQANTDILNVHENKTKQKADTVDIASLSIHYRLVKGVHSTKQYRIRPEAVYKPRALRLGAPAHDRTSF